MTGPPARTWKQRLARGCLGALLAACVAALAAWVWLTEPLDRSPLLGTPVARETAAALEDAFAAARARGLEQGRLRVGWATASITPPLGTATYGYGARLGKGVERITDDVFARAVAVAAGDHPPLVFVTADICLWVSDVSARIVEESGLPRARVFFGATHDHSGPGGYADGPAAAFTQGERRAEDVDRLVAGAVGAIRGALADLGEGEVREVSAPVPELIRNRFRKGEPLDDELMLVEYRKGERRCAWVAYAAHATCIGSRPLICSGDYPGALCRALEDEGYEQALFFAAGTGQAGPRIDGPPRYDDRDVDEAWRLGEALAARTRELAASDPTPFRDSVRLAAVRARVKLPAYRFRGLGRAFDPELAADLIGYPEALAWVHAVRLDDAIYLGHSFEFSSVISRGLKARARDAGGRLIVTSFNGDHNLYVVPDAWYDDPSYETGVTLFGPGLGSYLEAISAQTFSALRGLEDETPPTFDLGRKK